MMESTVGDTGYPDSPMDQDEAAYPCMCISESLLLTHLCGLLSSGSKQLEDSKLPRHVAAQ